jgi:pepF/M3 family oligoendopeptidase
MVDQAKTTPLPRWKLENIYPAIESPDFSKAFQGLEDDINALMRFMAENNIAKHDQGFGNPTEIAKIFRAFMEQMEAIWRLDGTLGAYLYGFISTDSFNTQAMKVNSELEILSVRINEINIRFRGWMHSTFKDLDELTKVLECDEYLSDHAYYLRETLEQAKFQMSPPEETLAAELALSGSNAWGKLQGTVTSQIVVPFELDGEVSETPMTTLQNIRRSNSDESVRRRAFEAEIAAWEGVRESLAACMNGIKGRVNTLNRKRGREDSLHKSLDQARISRETLSAMMTVMEESFPLFRTYFKAKAEKLGKKQLAWWDLFVGMSEGDRQFSFDGAKDFIINQLENFSPRLAAFTAKTVDQGWIDAEPRKGKRGGAFCMEVPMVEESRILMNFDGSLDQLLTLAHELGHAFHNECQVGLTMAQRETPMTLAETASIFNETLITDAALAAADTNEDRLAILESFLVNASQVIVDIYSRFLFEKEVFERREGAELSADDFCEIMLRVQGETYGDALDPEYRHAYMWAWKPHYYSAGRSYYNFPYAFGLLFGLGLYAIYKERGDDFVPDYEDLLRSTGQGTAEELAARFGMDIGSVEFWRNSMRVVEERIQEYCKL